MAIIKCKMCGGDIELSADKTYGTCDSCGSTMTFPKVDDEHRVNLFNRANHFRRQNEFDKAVAAYERILEEDDHNAEAHWGVVLSRFGIEYVEDPVSHERIPTCHRVQAASILTDGDYLAAVEHAPDSYSRSLYEAEAKRIAEIQKGILAISSKEKPYDVFICYKESTDAGSRTKDSTIAQDIYYQLKQEGFNVFFSRITLEEKLGQQYEPYIFAALNSAKVMLVVGTKPEYFNAVWVKNEWSRYLALMRQDRTRLLIPCYMNMDPYDLPEELSALQSQDMSKIGFMQDLIRGIKKIAQTEDPKPAVVVETAAPAAAVAPLLRRAFMFLEDKDWRNANEYCEKVLDAEPENGEAYLGKLMAKLQVSSREALRDCAMPFDHELLYQKAVRFGDNALSGMLKDCTAHIKERNENARLEGIYHQAMLLMRQNSESAYHDAAKLLASIPDYKNAARLYDTCLVRAEEVRQEGVYQEALQLMQGNTHCSESVYRSAAQKFASIPEYKDAEALRDECLAKAEAARKDEIYDNARRKMHGEVVADYEAAIKGFESIPGWKDAEAQIAECKTTIESILVKQENLRIAREQAARVAEYKAKEAAKKKKRTTIIVSAVAAVLIVLVCVWNFVLVPIQKYDAAVALMNAGKYDEAYDAFVALEDYKDSEEQIKACETAILDGKYDAAVALMNGGKLTEEKHPEAYLLFAELVEYRERFPEVDRIISEYDQEYIRYASAQAKGFSSNIEVVVGIGLDQKVKYIHVDSSDETDGFGVRCSNDEEFINQFMSMRAPFVLGENVDAVSGVTWTSAAVVEALNIAYDRSKEVIPCSMEEFYSFLNTLQNDSIDVSTGATTTTSDDIDVTSEATVEVEDNTVDISTEATP